MNWGKGRAGLGGFVWLREFADALAAHASGGKGATARMMQQLFGDELRRQTAGAASGAV